MGTKGFEKYITPNGEVFSINNIILFKFAIDAGLSSYIENIINSITSPNEKILINKANSILNDSKMRVFTKGENWNRIIN